MQHNIVNEVLIFLSNPYLDPVNLLLMAIGLIIGFYGTFSNAFASITAYRAVMLDSPSRSEDESKNATPSILAFSILCSFLIPLSILLFGIVNDIAFFKALGLIFMFMTLAGAYAGSKTRMDILRESGYVYDSGASAISNFSIFLKFPTGTWESEVSYIISYAGKILKKLIFLLVVVFILKFIYGMIFLGKP